MEVDQNLPDELGLVFARLGGVLLSEETVQTSIDLISVLATRSLPSSFGAGV